MNYVDILLKTYVYNGYIFLMHLMEMFEILRSFLKEK